MANDLDVRQMAAAPLADKPKDKDTKQNPLLAWLGPLAIVAGGGREYPRKTGWGADAKPHPDGGTTRPVAFAVVTPRNMADMPVTIGTVNRETFLDRESGKTVRKYSVSIAKFLQAPRGNSRAVSAVDDLRVTIRRQYEAWVKNAENSATLHTTTPERADTWTETE